jgi:RHS repeat-associated protein
VERGELNQSLPNENQQVTTFSYDNMLRVTDVVLPNGGGTHTSYGGTTNPRIVEVDTTLDSTGRQVVSQTLLDPYGRSISTGVSTGTNSWNRRDMCHDWASRVSFTSSPYSYAGSSLAASGAVCSGPGETVTYDAISRPNTATHADGNYAQADYSSNSVTSTDEARHKKLSIFDAIGRLTTVTEPDPSTGSLTSNAYTTTYGYDGAGHLTSVFQPGVGTQGARNRTFTYNDLGQLIQEITPEAGTVTYTYDTADNVKTKTDLRNKAVTYTYDALNRLTQIDYADGSASQVLSYDQTGHGFSSGRLTRAFNGTNASVEPTYDAMGRIASQQYTLPSDSSNTIKVSAGYDLLGDVVSLTYPDGRVVSQSFDTAARLSTVRLESYKGTPVGFNYLIASNYSAAGAPSSLVFGNGITDSLSYNNRLQLSQVTLANPTKTFWNRQFGWADSSGKNNNGSLTAVTDLLNSQHTQTFTYDQLDRIKSAQQTDNSLNQSFSYDSWGNLAQSGTWSFSQLFDSSNRISGGEYIYDPAGNLTNDTVHTYAYSLDNLVTCMDPQTAPCAGAAATYTYDAAGQRVRKDAQGTWTEYVYFGGAAVAEKSASGDWTDYILAGGARIAKAEALDHGLHIYGSKAGASDYSVFYFANTVGLSNYQIKTGDMLYLSQYALTGSKGGVVLNFTDGTNSNWKVKDQDGYWSNDDQKQTTTHFRSIDLSSLAGKTISGVAVNQETDSATGSFGIIYEQMVLVSSDGTVHPIYTGQATSPITTITKTAGVTGQGSQIDTNRNKGIYPQSTTTYYHGDLIGSARLVSQGGGWPVWQATFAAFGQEVSPTMPGFEKYKYAGYERDAESNLDHTWFRQYSTIGRWTTPDPAGAMSANPFTPQTWNRYAYAGNAPASFTDPSGLVRTPWGVASGNVSFGWDPFELFDIEVRGDPRMTTDGWGRPFLGTAIGFALMGGNYGRLAPLPTDLNNALWNALKQLRNSQISSKCAQNVLKPLGVTPQQMQTYLNGSASFYDGPDSTVPTYGTLVPKGAWNWLTTPPGQTVGSTFGSGTDAAAIPSAPLTVFFNTNAISTVNFGANVTNESTVFHEALHGLTGMGDTSIQNALFGPSGQDMNSTLNITNAVMNNCIQ